MRWPLGVIALLALGGCASAEQRMIATAKTKCAEQVAKEGGTLSWTAKKDGNRGWNVYGAVEPLRRWGVGYVILPDGYELGCTTFQSPPFISSGNRPSPIPTQP